MASSPSVRDVSPMLLVDTAAAEGPGKLGIVLDPPPATTDLVPKDLFAVPAAPLAPVPDKPRGSVLSRTLAKLARIDLRHSLEHKLGSDGSVIRARVESRVNRAPSDPVQKEILRRQGGGAIISATVSLGVLPKLGFSGATLVGQGECVYEIELPARPQELEVEHLVVERLRAFIAALPPTGDTVSQLPPGAVVRCRWSTAARVEGGTARQGKTGTTQQWQVSIQRLQGSEATVTIETTDRRAVGAKLSPDQPAWSLSLQLSPEVRTGSQFHVDLDSVSQRQAIHRVYGWHQGWPLTPKTTELDSASHLEKRWQEHQGVVTGTLGLAGHRIRSGTRVLVREEDNRLAGEYRFRVAVENVLGAQVETPPAVGLQPFARTEGSRRWISEHEVWLPVQHRPTVDLGACRAIPDRAIRSAVEPAARSEGDAISSICGAPSDKADGQRHPKRDGSELPDRLLNQARRLAERLSKLDPEAFALGLAGDGVRQTESIADYLGVEGGVRGDLLSGLGPVQASASAGLARDHSVSRICTVQWNENGRPVVTDARDNAAKLKAVLRAGAQLRPDVARYGVPRPVQDLIERQGSSAPTADHIGEQQLATLGEGIGALLRADVGVAAGPVRADSQTRVFGPFGQDAEAQAAFAALVHEENMAPALALGLLIREHGRDEHGVESTSVAALPGMVIRSSVRDVAGTEWHGGARAARSQFVERKKDLNHRLLWRHEEQQFRVRVDRPVDAAAGSSAISLSVEWSEHDSHVSAREARRWQLLASTLDLPTASMQRGTQGQSRVAVAIPAAGIDTLASQEATAVNSEFLRLACLWEGVSTPPPSEEPSPLLGAHAFGLYLRMQHTPGPNREKVVAHFAALYGTDGLAKLEQACALLRHYQQAGGSARQEVAAQYRRIFGTDISVDCRRYQALRLLCDTMDGQRDIQAQRAYQELTGRSLAVDLRMVTHAAAFVEAHQDLVAAPRGAQARRTTDMAWVARPVALSPDSQERYRFVRLAALLTLSHIGRGNREYPNP